MKTKETHPEVTIVGTLQRQRLSFIYSILENIK